MNKEGNFIMIEGSINEEDITILNTCASNIRPIKYMNHGLPWWSSGYDSALPLQGVQVRSLVRELRSHMLRGTAKKKKIHESKTDKLVKRNRQIHNSSQRFQYS